MSQATTAANYATAGADIFNSLGSVDTGVTNYYDYVPDVPASDQDQTVNNTINDVSKGQIDWRDFMKFANFQLQGRADDYFWGQPVGIQNILDSTGYQIASIVASFILPIAGDLAKITVEGIAELISQNYINHLKTPTDNMLAAMYGKYALWKTGGWWNKGITAKFSVEQQQKFKDNYNTIMENLKTGVASVADGKVLLDQLNASLEEYKKYVADVVTADSAAANSWTYADNPYQDNHFTYNSKAYTNTDLTDVRNAINNQQNDANNLNNAITIQNNVNLATSATLSNATTVQNKAQQTNTVTSDHPGGGSWTTAPGDSITPHGACNIL